MATYEPTPEVRLTIPDSLRLRSGATAVPRRRRGGRRRGAAAEASPAAVLRDALVEQGFEVLHEFETEAEPGRPPRRRARGGAGRLKVEVDLAAREGAVVLLEQDGVFSWSVADDTRERPRRTRSGRRRRATFSIPLVVEHRAARPSRRRGLMKDLVADALRGLVLRFVAGPAVEGIVRLQERHVHEGPVLIDSSDASEWRRLDTLGQPELPRERPARVLLLIHGTFSSTCGSFGALGAYQWGRAFLDAALERYDLVFGWDHRTLSQSPLENAVDLYRELCKVSWPRPPRIDAISFSRGGLVFRSLVEHLMPLGELEAEIGRAVFVGCTNSGTQLAEPDRWHAMLDLYTNLAVGATKALGMVAQAHLASRILAEAISGLGALAKALATATVTHEHAPGLAAMEPDGRFVLDLNRLQPGQPAPATSDYCAVTSVFDTRKGVPDEFPQALAKKLADRFSYRLLGVPNDLIVGVDSMTAIDRDHGEFVKDRLDFGPNATVYHTVYFHQPEVAAKLEEWLGLRQAAAAARPAPEVGVTARAQPPRPVDVRIRRLPVTASSAAAAAALASHRGDFVVFDRLYRGDTLHYALRTADVLPKLAAAHAKAPVIDVLGLHEGDASETRPEATIRPHERARPGHAVVVTGAGDEPVGVLASSAAHPSLTLSERNESYRPRRRRRRGGGRRGRRSRRGGGMRGGGGNGGGDVLEATGPAAAPDEEPATTAHPGPGGDAGAETTTRCSFRAETEKEVAVGEVGTVDVTLAREALAATAGAASAGAQADVELGRQLIVQIIAKAHCKAVGERRAVVDPPEPGRPVSLFFDYEPTHAGQGEIWIVVRQSQVALATLVLEPTFVATAAEARPGRTPAVTARSSEARPMRAPVHQLRIYDRVDGNEWFHEYELSSPTLGVLETFESKRSATDRAAYVSDLYQKLEDCWADNRAQFDKFMRDVRAFGADLYRTLIPEEMQRLIWKHRDRIESIQVISQEPFIPWEIVHLQEPGKPLPLAGNKFLGEMGLVRWLHGAAAGWPPETIRVRPERCRYVVPSYLKPDDQLPAAKREGEMLERILGAGPVDPVGSDEVFELLVSPDKVDALHFACHGEATPKDVWNAGLFMTETAGPDGTVEDVLHVQAVEAYANLRGDGPEANCPLVFVNACQTGRGGRQLTGTGGFAQAFLRRGAGAFVGALWSVDDEPSLAFATEFYEALQRGDSFSQATIAAREAAKNESDFTWLSYTVYAHPHGTIDGGP